MRAGEVDSSCPPPDTCRREGYRRQTALAGVYVERLMVNARHIGCRCWATAWTWSRWASADTRYGGMVPEAGGDRAQPVAARTPAPASSRTPLAVARSALRGPGHFQFLVDLASSDLPTCSSRCNPRLQGGVPSPRSDGRGPGAGADCIGGRPPPARPGPGPGAAAAHLFGAMPSSGASMPKRWMPRARPAGQQHHRAAGAARRGRACAWTRTQWRARRPRRTTTRCCQAHRLHARRRFCRRAAPLAARAGRVPHRRPGDNVALLQALAQRPRWNQQVHTRWVEEVLPRCSMLQNHS